VIECQVVSLEQIRRIAGLPPREVLLAQLVGSARAPLAGLVYTLSGLLAKFVRTVDALRAQKASAPETQA
jgi:large subunit ribosomal protein L10